MALGGHHVEETPNALIRRSHKQQALVGPESGVPYSLRKVTLYNPDRVINDPFSCHSELEEIPIELQVFVMV